MVVAHADIVRPLPELLGRHARRSGDKVWFRDRRTRVTYRESERRTARLAGHLAGLGVERGDRVAVLLGNRVEAVESLLAVTRASGVGVPLDPGNSDRELARSLADSGARVVLVTDVACLTRRRAEPVCSGLTFVVADGGAEDSGDLGGSGDGSAWPADAALRYEELVGTEPPTPARDDLALDEVAWLLYTSGSSGVPKGVLLTQRNRLAPIAAGLVGVLGLSEHDHVLWPLPLHHAMSQVVCFLGVTAVGASATVLPRFSVAGVLGELRREHAAFTLLGGVSTTHSALLDAVRGEAGGGLGAPTLRGCVSGGAAAVPGFRESFEAVCGVPYLEHYGSTEAGPVTMPAPGEATGPGASVRVLPDIRVRVGGGPDGREVGEGELWVNGPGVMVGYHGRPDATAEVLRDGWYRTGDLARIDALGGLAVTGRASDLIVRGGVNIHPSEVEAVLRRLPGVADAAVAGRAELSAGKVPVDLFEVAGLPRTASGKTLRRDLAGLPARALDTPAAGTPARDLTALVRGEVAALLGRTPRTVEPGPPRWWFPATRPRWGRSPRTSASGVAR